MYCVACGNEIHNDAVVCMKCGVPTSNMTTKSIGDSDAFFAWGILGFVLPMAGIILYFIWKDTKPKSAKSAGIGAIIRMVLMAIVYAIYFAFVLAMIGSV